MSKHLAGCWNLVAWRRIAGGETVTYPLGEHASGLLIYMTDGRMSVQMTAANRPVIGGGDALGGDVEKRAGAYSTCLAYFGSYDVEGDSVIHRIEASLFPDWSGVEQVRPFTYDGETLVLRTPPVNVGSSTVVNELSWIRGVP